VPTKQAPDPAKQIRQEPKPMPELALLPQTTAAVSPSGVDRVLTGD
jgi:hypothetical protein